MPKQEILKSRQSAQCRSKKFSKVGNRQNAEQRNLENSAIGAMPKQENCKRRASAQCRSGKKVNRERELIPNVCITGIFLFQIQSLLPKEEELRCQPVYIAVSLFVLKDLQLYAFLKIQKNHQMTGILPFP